MLQPDEHRLLVRLGFPRSCNQSLLQSKMLGAGAQSLAAVVLAYPSLKAGQAPNTNARFMDVLRSLTVATEKELNKSLCAAPVLPFSCEDIMALPAAESWPTCSKEGSDINVESNLSAMSGRTTT